MSMASIQALKTLSFGLGQRKLAMPVKTCRSVGLRLVDPTARREYWRIGVLEVIQTEVDKPRFRRSNVVIIGSVNVIEQNKLS